MKGVFINIIRITPIYEEEEGIEHFENQMKGMVGDFCLEKGGARKWRYL